MIGVAEHRAAVVRRDTAQAQAGTPKDSVDAVTGKRRTALDDASGFVEFPHSTNHRSI
jgi:hypothetical protein